MRIVFMGTPEFAVPCLSRLISDGHAVAGVFTQPDKPQGRGYKLMPPPVKVCALENGLSVYQPAKMRDGQALALLKELSPELSVVVAYGKILPPDILELPPLGCVNVHGSLLPKYRGAAPIQWSVLNGDRTAGVTTMYMAEGLDTGDMILKRETPLGPDETSGELYGRLAGLGAQALSETVRLIGEGCAPRVPQDGALLLGQLALDHAAHPRQLLLLRQPLVRKIIKCSCHPDKIPFHSSARSALQACGTVCRSSRARRSDCAEPPAPVHPTIPQAFCAARAALV